MEKYVNAKDYLLEDNMPITYLPAYSIKEDRGGNSIVRLVEKERTVNIIGFDGEVLSLTCST